MPDETCMPYSATDWTKFLNPYKNVSECPAEAKCTNCMPIQSPAPNVSIPVCWPVAEPIKYSVRAVHIFCVTDEALCWHVGFAVTLALSCCDSPLP